ncbi:MAG: ice-binding family protein, partial [Lacisediminimonas sp.]|nr:ice-binding family protein [Lacisediminimonas sp.]
IAALLAGTVVTIAGCGGSDDPVAVDISVLTAAGAGTGTGAGRGPAPVVLGGAGDYVILAESGITNVPTSAITGKIGLSAATGASITGLDDCSEIVGQVVHTVDNTGPVCRTVVPLILTPAIGAKNTAYTDAAGRAPDYTELGAGNIGGRNLGPATYKWSSALLIPTNVTLTGGPNDVWIFQIAQGMTVASGAQIILAGGALPQNVYWQTFSAEFNTTSQIKGTVLSQTSIAMKSGASITGRLFAGTATTLIQNVVTAPL